MKKEQILIIAKDFDVGYSKLMGTNYLSELLLAKPIQDNFEILVLSASKDTSPALEGGGLKLIKVPSSYSFEQWSGEIWHGETGYSLSQDIFQRTKESMRVMRAAQNLLSKLPALNVIHWFDPYFPFGSPLRFLSKIRGKKNFVTRLNYDKKSYFENQALKANLLGFDKIITGTQALKTFYHEIGFAENKLKVIPISVDLLSYKPLANKEEQEQAWGIPPDHKVLTWLGPIMPPSELEDFNFMLKIIPYIQEHSPFLTFVFAFKYGIPEGYIPLNENVRFFDHYESILNILNFTDLLILPFTTKKPWLVLPRSLIESLAAGVPVITVRNPAIEEAVINGYNGILVDSLDKMPETIINLLNQEERLKEMSKNARTVAEERFDINKVAEKYAELWSSP